MGGGFRVAHSHRAFVEGVSQACLSAQGPPSSFFTPGSGPPCFSGVTPSASAPPAQPPNLALSVVLGGGP